MDKIIVYLIEQNYFSLSNMDTNVKTLTKLLYAVVYKYFTDMLILYNKEHEKLTGNASSIEIVRRMKQTAIMLLNKLLGITYKHDSLQIHDMHYPMLSTVYNELHKLDDDVLRKWKNTILYNISIFIKHKLVRKLSTPELQKELLSKLKNINDKLKEKYKQPLFLMIARLLNVLFVAYLFNANLIKQSDIIKDELDTMLDLSLKYTLREMTKIRVSASKPFTRKVA